MSGMRTPVYSCYHIYSEVLDKNASRSMKGDLTTHSTILDPVSRRLLLHEICRTSFPLVVSQRKLVTLFSFFSIALSIFFKFHPALSLLAFCEQTDVVITEAANVDAILFFSNGTFDVIT